MEDTAPAPHLESVTGPADGEVIRRVLAGEPALFEVLMRRHNPRVYRAIRSVLRDESEVEDAMQQAYLQAYVNLSRFQFGSKFSTWLLRIAVNEALMRLRKNRRFTLLPEPAPEEEPAMPAPNPEQRAEAREMAGLLEAAVDALPDLYRGAFMLREVEGLSTAETADVLGVSEEVVKTRLHRARAMVREALYARVGPGAAEAFPFHAPRCDRVVGAVMAVILRGPGAA